ncbi:HET-domain-containing protein [Polyplosphaeria fusca]|uniref:HET-domain-containing protein n=1 Tax=Polyplosphaeria fusca TaxID=682080 RepID=A0A9P4QJC3_9PLEO|nr:HET-domain-containing protein [Polyplosphaeria fusca]
MIRLLRLKSRAHSPNLACEIVHCDMESDYKYFALSYAWGSGGQKEHILVDGYRCAISKHLSEALQHLQMNDEDQLYWIDQICINQANDEEKSDQVSRMRTIFERAWHVVAWLGRSEEDSDLLIAFFKLLAEEEGRAEDTLRSITGRLDWMSSYVGDCRIARITTAFNGFCNRNYWKRVWVIQEFALAKTTLICCGRFTIEFGVLQSAWNIIRRAQGRQKVEENSIGQVVQRGFNAPAMNFVSGILTRRTRYQEETPREPLFQVMCSSLTLETDYNQVQASDTRDRVFALMATCSDGAEFDTFRDYSTSPAKVYTILARRFLEQGHTDNLAHCQFPHNLDTDALPSWVPDWSMSIHSPIMGFKTHYRASATLTQSPAPSFPEPSTVALQGILVDTICETKNAWDLD